MIAVYTQSILETDGLPVSVYKDALVIWKATAPIDAKDYFQHRTK